MLLGLGTVLCAISARATVYSTNTGTVPGTQIQYTVTLEDDASSNMGIRFHLKNASGKTYYIQRSAFDVPGTMAIFFSTGDTPIVSTNAEWATDNLPSGSVMGCFPLLPGKTIDEIFPVGVYYDKIYKKRRETNIYVYWGATIVSASDDERTAELEQREVRPITLETFPRIGGMLTLPQKTED